MVEKLFFVYIFVFGEKRRIVYIFNFCLVVVFIGVKRIFVVSGS